MPETMRAKVLSPAAVRWGMLTLGGQRIHPAFVMYLYLRSRARAGELASASASSPQLEKLIRLAGHPTKPFFSPFIARGNRPGELLPTFWRAPNIAGSWSPGSLARQPASTWLVAANGVEYTMPTNHADRALLTLLFGNQVPVLALGAYFLRDDGFVITGEATAEDVVTGFRRKFDYPSDTDGEFDLLFSTESPQADLDFEWFEEQEILIASDYHQGRLEEESRSNA